MYWKLTGGGQLYTYYLEKPVFFFFFLFRLFSLKKKKNRHKKNTWHDTQPLVQERKLVCNRPGILFQTFICMLFIEKISFHFVVK